MVQISGPWLPTGWIGRCTIGYPWTKGCFCPSVSSTANLPFMKAPRTSAVFHWYDHLAAIFAPSLGIEDVIALIEALTKFTQQALSDSHQSLTL